MTIPDKRLSCLPKEHIIIMDNAAFHKKEVLQNLMGKYSQELIFLPPYSLECYPIGYMRSTLKQKVTSSVHLYGSASQALNAILEGN